jgi:hypothetical protein
MNATLVAELSLSASVKLARFDFSNRAFFVTSGLDLPEVPDPLRAEDLDGGLLTAFLSEVRPSPAVGTAQIRDVVEYADNTSTLGYNGHDPLLVSDLFPKMHVFSVQDLLIDESFKVFFLICLSGRRPEQWIDEHLAQVLNSVLQLSAASIPYETLCRSILDMDPGALFLALYRCLEALYALTLTQQLMAAVQISKPWAEMAQTLEETLGWYPREEPSLEALLERAAPEHLQAVMAASGETIPDNARSAQCVARRVYKLRNALVHYRPFHRKFSFKGVDWNRLCEAMVLLVFHVYDQVNGDRESVAE